MGNKKNGKHKSVCRFYHTKGVLFGGYYREFSVGNMPCPVSVEVFFGVFKIDFRIAPLKQKLLQIILAQVSSD